MTLLRDIEPLFWGARIFGCTPHRITYKDIFITKWGSVYSLILALFFLCGCCSGLYLIAVDVMEMKILLLTAVRTILSYVCFFTDATLTMIWNERLRIALRHLHSFDRITGFSVKIQKGLLNRCRMALSIVVLFWSVVGYLTYRCEKSHLLFNGITYGIVNAAISFQILKFVGFLILVYQRFVHLEKIIVAVDNVDPEPVYNYTKIILQNRNIQRAQVQDIWKLHYRLSNSAEEINSVYTTQLLFWITTMFLNALSRIYTLTGGDSTMNFLKIRESMAVTACLMNLIVIAATCHFTASQGNEIGRTMFCPRSAILRKRAFVEENNEMGVYFHLRKLHFSAGAGFIRIDLPLLLSIGGAMTTYLVILHALNNG